MPRSYDSWRVWTPDQDEGSHHKNCPAHEDAERVCDCDDSEDDHGPDGCKVCADLFDKPEDRCMKYDEVEPDCECEDLFREDREDAAEERRDRQGDR